MRTCVVVLGLALAGCSSGGPAQTEQGWPPPVAPGTLRLETPELQVDAGGEGIFCAYYEPTTEDMWVRSVVGYQHPGGHHSALIYMSKPTVAGGTLVECDEAVMTNGVYVGTGNGVYEEAHTSPPSGSTVLPPGMATLIPAGAQLIVQSHYLNTSSEPVRGKDTIDIGLLDAGEVQQRVDTFYGGTANFKLPPQSSAFAEASCTVDEQLDLLWLGGHTHRFGTLAQITHTRGDVSQVIYSETNGALLETDAPSISTFPDGSPLTLLPGDQISLRCEWANPEAHEVVFPEEMCGFNSQYAPGNGTKLCASAGNADNCSGQPCAIGDVCCLDALGAGTCSSKQECTTGWSCGTEDDCNAGDVCCSMPVVGNVCTPSDSCPGVTPCPTDGTECKQISEYVTIACCQKTGVCDFDFNCQ